MQLSAIQAFVVICETGSFRDAATRLHLTQPAISKRIATLEEQLGHQLFDRVGRRVHLTEAGRTYLPHARRLLLELEDGNRALDSLSQGVGGRLGLALSHHVGLHRMPPVLRRFIARYPQVDLDIEFLGSEDACQAIMQGRLELAVITLPEPPAAGLEQRALWVDHLQVLAAPDHPLAGQADIAPATLADHPALLPDVDTYTFAIIAQALAPFGVQPTPRLTSRYLETLKTLAAVGLGWTVLPASMADASLVRLPVTGVTMQRSLGSVRHPRRRLSNAGKALLDLLEEPPRPA